MANNCSTPCRCRAKVTLAAIGLDEALAMHGHMLDFKKRGSFIRIQWRKLRGLPAPAYGYAPAHIPLSRYGVEIVISTLFTMARGWRGASWSDCRSRC